MLLVKYWEWAACAGMAATWILFVSTGGGAIPHELTLVFIACLALSIL
jgi:hypothetical protein